MLLGGSQAVSEKLEASMAASAMRSIAALDASGVSATSSWPRRARKRVDVLEVGRAGDVLEVGPTSLLGFFEQ